MTRMFCHKVLAGIAAHSDDVRNQDLDDLGPEHRDDPAAIDVAVKVLHCAKCEKKDVSTAINDCVQACKYSLYVAYMHFVYDLHAAYA